MIDLSGKIIVITGGSGFLGSMFVRSALSSGASVIVSDVNSESGEQLVNELILAGFANDRVCFIPSSINNEQSVKSLIESAHRKFGRVDVLLNNAHPRNANYSKKLEDSSYHDFCENLNNHLGGYFLCMQQFSSYFVKQGHGNVISMSSIYGVVAPRFDIYEGADFTMPVDYAPIKSGIIHLTKYFARYYQGNGIRYNCISPGGVFNHQHPSFVEKYNDYGINKGMLDPTDLSGTFLFLASDLSKYINGQNLIVDDGWTL